MKLKEYLEWKKLKEHANDIVIVKIQKRGTGKKNGSTKRQNKTNHHDPQRD